LKDKNFDLLRIVVGIVVFFLIISGLSYITAGIDFLKFFPAVSICPFRFITGFKCPGCGMTHAFIHLSQFKIACATKKNIFSIPLLLVMIIYLFSGKRIKLLYSPVIKYSLLLLIILFWILRLYFKF